MAKTATQAEKIGLAEPKRRKPKNSAFRLTPAELGCYDDLHISRAERSAIGTTTYADASQVETSTDERSARLVRAGIPGRNGPKGEV